MEENQQQGPGAGGQVPFEHVEPTPNQGEAIEHVEPTASPERLAINQSTGLAPYLGEALTSPIQRPSIGRIVHYVNGHGRELAAIVVGVPFGSEMDADLYVFPYRRGHEWVAAHNGAAIEFDYDGSKKLGTWHWPERA